MKNIAALLIGFFLIFSYSKPAQAEISFLPSIGTGVGKNVRPSIVGALRLRESHTPLGLEAFILAPWGAGAVVSIDALRTEKLTIKLFDVGIFFPIINQVSVTNFDRNFDVVLGTGLIWKNYKIWERKFIVLVDWRIFFPDPRLFKYYGDFMRPIYKQAWRESFFIIGVSF